MHFYIGAGERDGSGHLNRSKQVIAQLMAFGHGVTVTGNFSRGARATLVESGYEISVAADARGDVLIVDATSIPPEFRSLSDAFRKKILISPVFDKGEIFSCAMTRAHTDTTADVIKAGGRVVIDPRFAFAGLCPDQICEAVRPRNRVVGVCISGGESYADIETILEGLSRVTSIKKVIVVGHNGAIANNVDCEISFLSANNDLWGALGHVDLFVTGDGLMLFEAIARAVPAISIVRPNAHHKNRFFYENGWCKKIDLESLSSKTVSRLAEDVETWQTLNALLHKKNFARYGSLLAQQIDAELRNLHGIS